MLSKTIADAKKIFEAYKLKFTYRFTDRPIYNWEKESVAAHSWWVLLTADYLLERLESLAPGKYKLDREKIYSLIIYHDLIEVETGDVDIDPTYKKLQDAKQAREVEALKTLPGKLPVEIQARFLSLFQEYEKRETLESKFVKILDIIECEFTILERADFFENWTYEYRESIRKPHFQYFPELEEILDDILEYTKNYFPKHA